MSETCAICGCPLHRDGEYAKPTVKGRSHATEHHYVAKRFFGRSKSSLGTRREAIFDECPWCMEGKTGIFCYECHEELLHNPVFLPEDIRHFADLVKLRKLSEGTKTESRQKIGGRIKLLHEIIVKGLQEFLASENKQSDC